MASAPDPAAPPAACDLLISGADLVTFDDEQRLVPDGALAVRDGVIVDLGPRAEVERRWRPAERLDATGTVAAPGMVDAHVHTGQMLLRGLLSTLELRGALKVPTWRHYYVPFEAQLSPEDMRVSAELMVATMLLGGTTSFFEAGAVHAGVLAQVADEMGIRALVSPNTMDDAPDLPASMVTTTDAALQANVELVEQWPAGRRVSGAMSLRQITTCTPELIRLVSAEARTRGVRVHSHLVEGTYEIDYTLDRYGMRPIEHLMELGAFTDTLHAAHSVLVDDDDIASYRRHDVSVAHCAFGNYRIGAAPAITMWRRGIRIGLGTDGPAMQGTLDVFRVAAATGVVQQYLLATPRHDRRGIPPTEPMAMATRGGARALGLDDRIGSLEVGKAADLVLVDTDSPDAAAYTSAIAFYLESATGRDVRDVLVDGRVLVRDRVLTGTDHGEVVHRANVAQRRLVEGW